MGVYIPVALALAGVVSLVVGGETDRLYVLADVAWNNANSFVLSAAPMFVFMGAMILKTGLGDRLYDGLAPFLERLPGGLLHTNIFASGGMAAVTGSSVATVGSIGATAVPALEQRGYAPRLIYGTLAVGGTLGIVIPPSIILILYGALAQSSVASLFAAGIVPGLLLMMAYSLYVLVVSLIRPQVAPRSAANVGARAVAAAGGSILPLLVLFLLVLGSIYLGYATPTEAGALGAAGAAILAVAYGKGSWATFGSAFAETVRLISMVMLIVVGAAIYAYALVQLGVSRYFVEQVIDAGFTGLPLLVTIAVIFLLLGCIIDGLSIMYLTLPLLLPVIEASDISLIWFGIFVTILIEAGQVTPPMGFNLFVLDSLTGPGRRLDVRLGVLPFVVVMLVVLVLLVAFPDIALWLPSRIVS